MDFENKSKTDCIRELLLKTVGRNPDLFSYIVAVQEARKLLGKTTEDINFSDELKPVRKVAEG